MATHDVHLLVLVHGMWGNPGHLAEMKRIIQDTNAQEVASKGIVQLDVLVAQANMGESTYDGIDWGGERIADEVVKRVKDIEDGGMRVVKFSIAGYSLGGLVSRYVIGILQQRSFFSRIKPVNFATFATPHIGLLRTSSIWSSILATLGPTLLSRTGEQFYAVDVWGATGRSLLEVMADPKGIFYQALSAFESIRIYGNAVNDLTVPCATALIESEDPFINRAKTGINVEFDPKYDPIITSYSIPDNPPVQHSPTPLSPSWFRNIKPYGILPPPFRSLRFPLSAIAIILVPILIPTFFMLLLIRLSLHARSSRARIRLLEGDESLRENALVHAFTTFERGLERAVVTAMEDDQGSILPANTSLRLEKPSTNTANGRTHSSSSSWPESLTKSANENINGSSIGESKPGPGQPILTPAQREMVRSLNALPRLTKHRAYIDPVRNSHATIIARDVKGFSFHKRGWGVLQHWADAFVL